MALDEHPWLGAGSVLIGVILLSIIVMLVVRKIVLPAIGSMVRKAKTKWDDVIFDSQVFRWVSWLPGLLVLYWGVTLAATLNNSLGGVVVVLQNVTGRSCLDSRRRSRSQRAVKRSKHFLQHASKRRKSPDQGLHSNCSDHHLRHRRNSDAGGAEQVTVDLPVRHWCHDRGVVVDL